MTVANDHIDIDAIAEAVPQEKPVQPPDYRHHFLQGLESCRVAVNVPNSERDNSVFGYLLEAISGPTGDGDEGSVSVVHQSDALKSSRQHARTEQEVRSVCIRGLREGFTKCYLQIVLLIWSMWHVEGASLLSGDLPKSPVIMLYFRYNWLVSVYGESEKI